MDWIGEAFLSHYGFRARPINGELIGFMCRSLNQKNVPWSLRPIRDCLIIECFLEVKIPKYSHFLEAGGNFLPKNFIPNSCVLSKSFGKWRLNLHYLFRFTKSGLYCSCKLTWFSVTLGYQDEWVCYGSTFAPFMLRSFCISGWWTLYSI